MRWLLILVAVVGALGLALAFLPLRWVTDRYVPDLAAERVEGSIWSARLTDARFQEVALGDVEAGLAFTPLLAGRAEIGFRRLDAPMDGHFVAGLSQSGVRALTGTVALPLLPAPLPPVTLTLEDVALKVNRQRQCVSASGMVSTSLDGLPAVGDLPLIAGAPRCDGADLLIPMQAGNGRAGVDIRVQPGANWTATLRIDPDNPVTMASLALAGFRRDGTDMTLSVRGNAQGVTDRPDGGSLARLGRALAGTVVDQAGGVDAVSVPMPSPPAP